jgi:hypothetical protein
MKDATIAVDKATAICLEYSRAGEIVRIEDFGTKQVFYSTAKRFDREAVQDEMKDEKVSVYLKPFLESVRKIEELLALTKADGVWQKKVGGES